MFKKFIKILIFLIAVVFISTSLFARRAKRTVKSSGPATMKKLKIGPTVKVDTRSMEKRNQAISQLKDLIKDYPEGPRKAEVYRRLAELYWEKARAIKSKLMAEYNKKTDKYYELNDPNAQMPELNLKPAWKWNRKAIDVCDYIMRKYPDFSGLDEVYYFMASNLMEVGQPLKAIREYKLIVEKYPKSKHAADAYFQMGEYFFNHNNVFKAIPNYKAIIDKFKKDKFYGFALYKYAWCMYNVGEYKKSVAYFQKVVEYSNFNKKVDLKENALKDMVAPFAEAGTVDEAEKYFKTIVKSKKYYIMVLSRLSAIYFEQDRSKEAIVIYKKLLKEVPNNERAPRWQKQIVECYKKMNDKEKVREGILELVKKYADPNSSWYKANAKDDATVESARQTAEASLRLLVVEYHNEARKTGSKETWSIVGQLYPVYLKYFPKSEAAYDMRFNYAEYLHDQKKFVEAGEQYQIVADSNPKGSHFEDASFGAVSCFGELLKKDQEAAKNRAKNRVAKHKKEGNGKIQRSEVHVASEKGELKKQKKVSLDEFKEKPIPELHKKFLKACETYVKNIPRSKYLVNIMYQEAITYYAFNHFKEAVPKFEMIIKKYPRSNLAVYATDLIMDSLNITKDWEAISKKAREFLRNTALLSGRNRLKKDLESFKEKATFYAAEIPAHKGNPLESAERYMAFVTEFPKSKFNDVALYNAIVFYQKGGDLYKSIRVQERFLRETDKVYKKSKLRNRIMFGLAKNYEAIAYYEKAAGLYVDFVEKAKEDKHVPDAIFNAAVLYENIGETDKAIDNYKLYIEKYAKTEAEKQKLALQFGYIWMRKGKTYFDKAKKGFHKFLDKYAHISGLKNFYYLDKKGQKKEIKGDLEIKVTGKGDPNTIFAVYKALIDIAEKENNKVDYYNYIDKILQLSRKAVYENKKPFAEVARDVIAKALLEELKPDFKEYMSLNLNIKYKKKMKGYDVLFYKDEDLMPAERVQKKAAKKEMDRFNKKTADLLIKKVKLLADLEKKYMGVIATTKSPRYTPAALYYIGMLYKNMTDVMNKAPLPPWLNENQKIIYKQKLDEKAINARQKALEAFEKAMYQGYKTSVYNDWVKKAKYQLRFFQELRPGKYYDENEIVPKPDMIETSSEIGKLDIEIKFPKITKEERKNLKKILNKTVFKTPAVQKKAKTKTTK